MNRIYGFVFSTVFTFLPVIAHGGDNAVCVVKEGAVVSQIARDICTGPLYGDEGCLQRVLAVNPLLKNPNCIFPGQELLLPETDRISKNCTVKDNVNLSEVVGQKSEAKLPFERDIFSLPTETDNKGDYLGLKSMGDQLAVLNLEMPKNHKSYLSSPPEHDYLRMADLQPQLQPSSHEWAELKNSHYFANVNKKYEPSYRQIFDESSGHGVKPSYAQNSKPLFEEKLGLTGTPDLSQSLEAPETYSSSQDINYCIVKKGAVFSKIARDICAGPLYKREGCLSKMLTLNNINNPNLIFPGQKLVIPKGDKTSSHCEIEIKITRVPPDQASTETVKRMPATFPTEVAPHPNLQ